MGSFGDFMVLVVSCTLEPAITVDGMASDHCPFPKAMRTAQGRELSYTPILNRVFHLYHLLLNDSDSVLWDITKPPPWEDAVVW